jgi:hypothetical protein
MVILFLQLLAACFSTGASAMHFWEAAQLLSGMVYRYTSIYHPVQAVLVKARDFTV